MNGQIYLDYAASAPLCHEAAQAMLPYLEEDPRNVWLGANPNSLHSPGRAAFSALEEARRELSSLMGARQNEMVFCASATEADNMSLFGLTASFRQRNPGAVPQVVSSAAEHDAIRKSLDQLHSLGLVEARFVDPLPTGHVPASRLEKALTDQTALVSIVAVSNETGAVNDIAALGALAHDAGALFHTDAVQLLGKSSLDLGSLPVDAASFSAHKIGGPKGIGLLYLKTGVPFSPFISGGGQERGRRSGTQDACRAAGFAAACKAACGDAGLLDAEHVRLRGLRDMLYEGLCSIPGVHPTVPCEKGSDAYAPHIVHVHVDGIESETLVLQFDLAHIAVSGGSACSSHSLDPSPGLLAMGLGRDAALETLRVSVGRYSTEADVVSCIEECARIVAKQKG